MRILNWIKSLFDKDTEHLLIRIEELEENVNELIFYWASCHRIVISVMVKVARALNAKVVV